jgi:transcriptional regulator with XRE-family HTH domain
MKVIRRSRAATAKNPTPERAIGNVLCNRVRELRRKKQWTLAELAAASGVSRSMLNDIERGRANPTLVVAHRIAIGFGLSLGELIEMPQVRRLEIIRGEDRTYHFQSDRRCRMRTLSPLVLQKEMEFYEIVLGKGGALHRSPHYHGTRELITVHRGTIRITAGGETADLKAGDSVYYPGDVTHSIENRGREEAVLYQVVTYRHL